MRWLPARLVTSASSTPRARSPTTRTGVNAGSCALMGDSNDHPNRVEADRAAGWDYEGYRAGVYVGPKFGCIHWAKRDA